MLVIVAKYNSTHDTHMDLYQGTQSLVEVMKNDVESVLAENSGEKNRKQVKKVQKLLEAPAKECEYLDRLEAELNKLYSMGTTDQTQVELYLEQVH